MKRLICALAVALASVSCDSGDIYPDDTPDSGGTTAYANVGFDNLAAWPTAYSVVIAAFADGNDYPLVSKAIAKPSGTAAEAVTLPAIPDGADYVSICLLRKNRQLLYSFRSQRTATVEDESIVMPDMTIDLLEYGRIQSQVFANCTQCHGGSSEAAAGLYLTPERSYDALVGVRSAIADDMPLVSAGHPEDSFLVDVLRGDGRVHFNHTNGTLSNDEEDTELIETWIKALQ